MNRFDVIIVGAGPSGSTAAKYLAEQGQNVLLIDRQNFPRDKACAGGLCSHIESFSYLSSILRDKGSFVKSSCHGSMVYVPPGIKSYEYTSDSYLFNNVFRRDFDDYLLKLALKSGARFKQHRVIDVKNYDSHTSIRTASGETYTSHVLIGADGPVGPVGTFVRKKLGYETKWKKRMCLSLVEEIPLNEKYIENNYGPEKKAFLFFKWARLNGYAWVFPKKDTMNIGYSGLIDEMKKRDVHQTFYDLLSFLKKQHLLPDNIISKNVTGGLIPWDGPLQKTVLDRIILTGDAAGFVSPLSGEGIFYAMDSGRIAAEIINTAISTDTIKKSELQRYHQKCMNAWGKNLSSIKFFRRILFMNPSFFLNPGKKNKQLQKIYGEVFNGELEMVKACALLLPLLLKETAFDTFKK